MTEACASHEKRGVSGTLVLVVGQSGVGKDTLLQGARTHFKDDPGVIFVERTITRLPEPTELHHAVTLNQFEDLRSRGAFAFFWEAHGLSYGVPKSIDADLTAGRLVICNASRTTVAAIRASYGKVVVLEVTAGREALRQRLIARGREGAEEIEQRLDRKIVRASADIVDIAIENDASREQGIETLINALKTLASKVAR
jgi:ribose 1,5-bisphosphokinase